jgi:hypothetical protein
MFLDMRKIIRSLVTGAIAGSILFEPIEGPPQAPLQQCAKFHPPCRDALFPSPEFRQDDEPTRQGRTPINFGPSSVPHASYTAAIGDLSL